MALRILLLAALIGLLPCLFTACRDDIQFSAPPPKAPASGRGKLPAGHPPLDSSESQASKAGGGAAEEDPFADPADAHKPVTSGVATSQVDPNRVFFRGRVEVDPSLKLPATYAIFVCAGNPPRGSPPVLSKLYAGAPKFPFDFELRGKDLAFGDTAIDAPMVLYLIVSEKGYVLAQEGLYFKTPPSEPIALDATGIVLTLKQP